MAYSFVAEVVASVVTTEPAYWFVFIEDQLLAQTASAINSVFYGVSPPFTVIRSHYLGKLNGVPVYAAEIETPASLENLQLVNLRQSYDFLGVELFNIASRAYQILNWDRNHQYCGRCSAPLQIKSDERAKQCMQCGLLVYPRISPCVIVLVHRGDEILLARSPHFRPEIYSTLAGFIEPGESAEETVMREIKEEVGVEVKNIQYMGSQSWPFPDSFMLGFFAEYANGEIKIDPKEIEDAQWFNLAALPPLPSAMSIASRLIQRYIESR